MSGHRCNVPFYFWFHVFGDKYYTKSYKFLSLGVQFAENDLHVAETAYAARKLGMKEKGFFLQPTEVTFCMRVVELISVAGRLPGSICSRPCRCRQHQPAHLPEIGEVSGGWRLTGRCPWAGWRRVAYTNVDTARRMRGCFNASDDWFVSCGRVEVLISLS